VAIWLNELEAQQVATPQLAPAETGDLRSRSALICALERASIAGHLRGRSPVLVMLHLVARGQPAGTAPLQTLRDELQQLPYTLYRLRDGEQAFVVDDAIDGEALRLLLAGLNTRLKRRAGLDWALVAGAVVVQEDRPRPMHWVELAHRRLHEHAAQRGAQLPSSAQPPQQERRQLH
jgi:hypothetical protein